ncbi:hypothetical protein [Pseudoalteromonas holothuriae]|nr:hypothetical protein [Pseudoalteromonas sp. CIP111854]
MMSNNLKIARLCGQYAQLFEHRFTTKQAQINELIVRIDDVQAQHKSCAQKLDETNNYFFKANVIPEMHQATLNHVASLTRTMSQLSERINELKLERETLEQELKLLKLKQKVIDNQAGKFELQELQRLHKAQDKQLEQLWVINMGGKHRA